MNDKMREEFVTWLESLGVGYDTRFTDFIGGLGDGEFYDAEVQGLWTTWQASRAAIEIELPSFRLADSYAQLQSFGPDDLAAAYKSAHLDCHSAIERAGLKVRKQ